MGYKFFNKLSNPMRTQRHVSQIKDSIVIVDWMSLYNQLSKDKEINKSKVKDRPKIIKNRFYVFIQCFKAYNVELIFVFDNKCTWKYDTFRNIMFGMGMEDKLSVKYADEQASHLYQQYESEGKKCYVYSQDSDYHFYRCRTINRLVVDDQKHTKRLGIFSYLYLPEWKDPGDNRNLEQQHRLLAKISLQPEKMQLLGALLALNHEKKLRIYLEQWINMVAEIQKDEPPFQLQKLAESITSLREEIFKKSFPGEEITAHDIRSQLFNLRCKPIFNEKSGEIEVTDPQYYEQHRQYLNISQEDMFQLIDVNKQRFLTALNEFENKKQQFTKSTKYDQFFNETKQRVDSSMKRYEAGKKIAKLQKKQRENNRPKFSINLNKVLQRCQLTDKKHLKQFKLTTVIVDSNSLFFDQLNTQYQIYYTVKESLIQLQRFKQYLSRFIETFRREKIRLIFVVDLDNKCPEAPWMTQHLNHLQIEKQQSMVISHEMLLMRAKNLLIRFIASNNVEIDYVAGTVEQQAVHIYRTFERKGGRSAIYSQNHIFHMFQCRTIHSLHVQQPEDQQYGLTTYLFLSKCCKIQNYVKYVTELIEVSKSQQRLYLLTGFYMANQEEKCGVILEAMIIIVNCVQRQPSYVPMTISGLLGIIAKFKEGKYKHILTQEFKSNLRDYLFRFRFGAIFNKDNESIEPLDKQAIKKYTDDAEQLKKTIEQILKVAQAKQKQRRAVLSKLLEQNLSHTKEQRLLIASKSNGNKI